MKLRPRLSVLSLAVAFSVMAAMAHAEVTLPNVIGESMVLQQGMPAPIWGWAEAGEEVIVSFAGQTKTTEAGDDGRWQVKLDALKANAKGQTLTVKGSNTIELKDVLIGEVSNCSVQSNMEWSIRHSAHP